MATMKATVTFKIDGYTIYAGQLRPDTDPAVLRFPSNFTTASGSDSGDVVGGGGGGSGTDATARAAAAAAQSKADLAAAAAAAITSGAPAELDQFSEALARFVADEANISGNTAAIAALPGIYLPSLADATVNGAAPTLAAGVTSSLTASGAAAVAPAPSGSYDASKPQRFAVTNQSGGNVTLALPNVAGNTITLTLLPGEGRIYRQSGTAGYRLESGIPLAQQDARYDARYDPIGAAAGLALVFGA